MALDFDTYIGLVDMVELKKGVKTDSTATLEIALNYYRGQVNSAAELSDYDTRAEMVDRRTTQAATDLRQGWGNQYQIFSDKYVARYNLSDWWVLKLDMFSILELLARGVTEGTTTGEVVIPGNVLTGVAKRVIFTEVDGVKTITFDNPNNYTYEVFTYLDESIGIEDVVDKIDATSFTISLIDQRSFEVNKPLDCSTTNFGLNYIIVFTTNEI